MASDGSLTRVMAPSRGQHSAEWAGPDRSHMRTRARGRFRGKNNSNGTEIERGAGFVDHSALKRCCNSRNHAGIKRSWETNITNASDVTGQSPFAVAVEVE